MRHGHLQSIDGVEDAVPENIHREGASGVVPRLRDVRQAGAVKYRTRPHPQRVAYLTAVENVDALPPGERRGRRGGGSDRDQPT